MANETTMSPQAALWTALSGLLTALVAAEAAIRDPNTTPAMIGAALNGVGAAQQNYNNMIVRIPIALITESSLPSGDAGPEATSQGFHAVENEHPAARIKTTNARVWADTFLAVNKNQAIDRESLTHWFGHALAAGAVHVIE